MRAVHLWRTALLFLTLGAYALRVAGLERQSFWLDEVDALAMARAPLAAHLPKLSAIGENGPLYFLLFKGWLRLSGEGEFGARALSCLASTAIVPLLGVLARRLTGSIAISLAAALLGAASPYYIWYGQDAKMYPLYAALALAAQYALLRGLSPSGTWRWWAVYVLASSCALYVHLFAALQIAANTAAGLVVLVRRPARWRGFAVATSVLILPYLPLALWQGRVLLSGADVGYRPTPLPSMVIALAEQFTWHLIPPPDRRLLGPVLAIAVLGLYRLMTLAPALPALPAVAMAARVAGGRESRPAGPSPGAATVPATPVPASIVLCWLLVPLILVYLIQFTVPVFRDRYLIPLLAPLLLVFAAAMTAPFRTAALLTSVFLAASFGYAVQHRPPNPDFRAAAAVVREALGPGERIGFLAGYAERPFAHYFVGSATPTPRYERASLPYTDYPEMTEQAGLVAVANAMRAREGLWIVRFEDWLWDSRGLVTEYLRNRGAQRTVFRDFNGVSIERWQVP